MLLLVGWPTRKISNARDYSNGVDARDTRAQSLTHAPHRGPQFDGKQLAKSTIKSLLYSRSPRTAPPGMETKQVFRTRMSGSSDDSGQLSSCRSGVFVAKAAAVLPKTHEHLSVAGARLSISRLRPMQRCPASAHSYTNVPERTARKMSIAKTAVDYFFFQFLLRAPSRSGPTMRARALLGIVFCSVCAAAAAARSEIPLCCAKDSQNCFAFLQVCLFYVLRRTDGRACARFSLQSI